MIALSLLHWLNNVEEPIVTNATVDSNEVDEICVDLHFLLQTVLLTTLYDLSIDIIYDCDQHIQEHYVCDQCRENEIDPE